MRIFPASAPQRWPLPPPVSEYLRQMAWNLVAALLLLAAALPATPAVAAQDSTSDGPFPFSIQPAPGISIAWGLSTDGTKVGAFLTTEPLLPLPLSERLFESKDGCRPNTMMYFSHLFPSHSRVDAFWGLFLTSFLFPASSE